MNIIMYIILLGFASNFANAKPYWDESKVPKDSAVYRTLSTKNNPLGHLKSLPVSQEIESKPALRVTLNWISETESYELSRLVIEDSGTDSLYLRSKIEPKWGSYQGRIYLGNSTEPVYFDSIGTGKEYRKLVPQITFRFPVPSEDFKFELIAENPISGEMESVFLKAFKKGQIETESKQLENVEFQVLKAASVSPSLKMSIYAEGYLEGSKDRFFKDAQRVVDTLVNAQFPSVEHMEFIAVFAPSKEKLGQAKNLGLPVQPRDSFLGLYYPYWNNFGRWYHIVYPTSEEKFRQNLAVVPYDHNIILVDSFEYWGVGNYKTHTAIPSQAMSFEYLLLHEIGHYFGLNEEYEGGGRTELEFAPKIKEVWSQNITLLPVKELGALKWVEQVSDPLTPIPTPHSFWSSGKYGAYKGGYADSKSEFGDSHKPGLSCVMDRYKNFCHVCRKGIQDTLNRDLGIN